MYNLLDDSTLDDRGSPPPLLSLESKHRIKLLEAFCFPTKLKTWGERVTPVQRRYVTLIPFLTNLSDVFFSYVLFFDRI